jgi:acyl-CoA thioester hydrolase
VTSTDAADPNAYHHWTSDVIRFSDQNTEGHLNSVAISTYVESGRVSFGQELKRAATPGATFMLARLVIDYHAEAHYPGSIRVGTSLVAIGRKSLTIGHGVFKDDECIATAEAVLVYYKDGASAIIDGELRTDLERLRAGPK